ncbi:hypothetical protein BsWGS_00333 [Bradybaena similaris]
MDNVVSEIYINQTWVK